MNQAVFTGEEDAVTVNIILKRSTFGDSFTARFWKMTVYPTFSGRCSTARGSNRALVVRCGKDERLRSIVLDMCGEGLFCRKERLPEAIL